MSGGGSSAPQMMFLPQQQQTSQTSTTQLPAWVNNASQSNYNEAAQIAPQLGEYYQGPMVAGLNQGQLGAINAINQNANAATPYFQSALGTSQALQNYTPDQVQAQTLPQGDLNSYMNPYTQNVINSSMDVMRAGALQARNKNADDALRTRAFGGSRQAIQDAATDSNFALQAAHLNANLQNQNYGQAVSSLQNDQARQMQAQLANQAAGLQGANLGLNAAQMTGALASGGQDAFLTGQNAALTGSGMLQSQQQNEIAGQQAALAAKQAALVAPVNLKMAALGMSPYGQTTTSNGSSFGLTAQAYQPQYSSPLMSGIGMGIGGLGALKSLGGMAGIAGLFSDEDEKTNIEELGEDPETGLPMYAYDYKADVKKAKNLGMAMPPKRVGPMAQDIEKRDPKAVKKIGGKRVVNLGLGKR